MFTLYTLLLTLHILAVIAWFGTGLALFVLSRRVTAETEPFFTDHARWLGSKWFPATAGAAALTGIGLWIDGPWELGTTWIWIAVAGWVVTGVLATTQMDPAVGRWHGGDRTAAAKVRLLAQIDLALMTLIVADMVMKPGA